MSRVPACQIAGEWLSGFSLGDAPETVRRQGIQCLVDVIGCTLGGAATDIATTLRAHVADEYGDGRCRIIGTDTFTTASGAAMANGVAAHVLDFDDTCYAGIAHGSATVAPAVLAAAALSGADGQKVLAGLICGLEVEYGLGKAFSNSFYMRGWWATSVLGTIGAAAGAARVLGLDGETAGRAVALSTAGANGVRATLGSDAKPVLNGQAAAAGLNAALLAGRGITVALDIIEDSRGLAQVINDGTFDPVTFDQLGKDYSLLDPGIFIKPFPCCSAAHAAAEAVGDLMRTEGLNGDAIEAVICEVPNLVNFSLAFPSPAAVTEAQFSMPYIIGCLLTFGRFGVEELRAELLADERLIKAMAKVRMIEDETLTTQSEAGEIGPECARVIITTTDGRTFDAFNSVAIGAPSKPMSRDALDEKFLALAAHGGHADEAQDWLAGLYDIETSERSLNLWT